MEITVIGGGSWGTAIARLLKINGHEVSFYVRDPKTKKAINDTGCNDKYLPGISLEGLKATTNIDVAIDGSRLVVMAVPSQNVRSVFETQQHLLDGKIIVNLSKGLELGTLDRISQIAEELLPKSTFVALSGPSHAEEVGRNIPTAVVAASKDIDVAKMIQNVFSNDSFRVYTNTDLVGVEIGGALKNIIALAAGMSEGLGFGDNTTAALATRGIYEMSKLGLALGAEAQTFNGLSGIGDLIVTCTSTHSRNRRAGILIGKGLSKDQASLEVGQVVEGIKTTKSAYELSKKHKISMPITQKLYEVLYQALDPRKAVVDLMRRDYKDEIEPLFKH
ncbi:NAD(P)H-dependent glycerol-3-phosphate dehydrogenase [Peptoniphilus equinus]|uniref:Glycerol-3-phosphate dehydrogenase [NAD(P)+] n=1 Tax=Peptoniphilus equinus TaxID=3016343 RepID=A0ABY7QVA5_9FIRM|nr:NAD(P)H-dependent glycerol-3-phosphate dehydrogenase [Peptoniphilus equinus]WBW50718.1 NAD(P)H-dependent glycerol-3-phosphate dehydrogenase [Peptoniphilus equinus]